MKKSIILTTLCAIAASSAFAEKVQMLATGSTDGTPTWTYYVASGDHAKGSPYDFATLGIDKGFLYIQDNVKITSIPDNNGNGNKFIDLRFITTSTEETSTLDLGGNTLYRTNLNDANRTYIINSTNAKDGGTHILKNGTIQTDSTTTGVTKTQIAIGNGAIDFHLGDADATESTINTTLNASGTDVTVQKFNDSVAATFTIEKDAKLTGKSFTTNSQITSYIKGTLEVTGASTFNNSVTISGSISGETAKFNSTATINEGGEVITTGGHMNFYNNTTIAGTVDVTNSSYAVYFHGGESTLTSTGSLSAAQIRIQEGAKLTLQNKFMHLGNNGGVGLYGKNVTLVLDGVDVLDASAGRQISLNAADTAGTTVIVQKSNHIKWFGITQHTDDTAAGSSQQLTVNLAGTASEGRALLELNQMFAKVGSGSGHGNNWIGSTLLGATFEFTNFDNGDLWFAADYVNDDTNGWQADFEKIKINGEVVFTSQEDFNNKWMWEAAQINNRDGYYLISKTAVPEPAEWAAIFGAVALGFAMYRHRK